MTPQMLARCAIASVLLAAAGMNASSVAASAPTFDQLAADAKSSMMSNPALALSKATAAQNAARSMSGQSGSQAVATAIWLRSEALTRLGRPREALPEIERGLALLDAAGRNTKVYADLLKSEAAAHSKLGDVGKSLPLLHKAFAAYGRLDEPRAQAIILHNIAAIYYDARDYERMLQYLEQAEKLFNSDQSLAIALHNNRGNALKELGRFSEAHAEYAKALEIGQALDSPLLEVTTMSNLAVAQLMMGRLEAAQSTVDRALQKAQGPALEQRPFLLGTLAQIALKRGDLASAGRYIEASFAGVDLASSNMPFRDYHEAAYKIFDQQGRDSAALAHLAAFKRLDDSGRELAASTNAALISAQFDDANNKLQISRLEAKEAQRGLALAQSEAKLQQYSTLIIAGSLAFLCFLIIFAHRVSVARKRRDEMALHNANLVYAANHDGLTGLPNRSYFKELVEASIEDSISREDHCAILMIDLDRFKWVNDTHGHSAGDELLCAVAAALKGVVGDLGTPVRLGGDEFAVFIPKIQNRSEIKQLASSIVKTLRKPFEIAGSPLRIGGTVGFSIGPEDGTTFTELARAADMALYAGKESGRNCVVQFDNAFLVAANHHRTLREDMHYALGRGELDIAYQAIVNIADNRVIGYEALMRWKHPTLGAISPAVFIPIAEESGLIEEIGGWIVKTACIEAALWPDNQFVSVNLSAIQIKKGRLARQLIDALASSGLAPERLELEVTESAFLGHSEDADQILGQLRSLGVRLALDDFGTGYSSLAYLRRATFSTIKIDQSFVRAASGGSAESMAIIRAIVALASEMGIVTTAEGIETEHDLAQIRALGCTQAQGYLFAKPVSRPSQFELKTTKAA